MLTAQQIVSLATQAAKVPGMLQQAGQLLNARLVQIALEQDLDIIRRTTTIAVTVGTGGYALPTNYLRAREVFYNIAGTVYWLTSRSLEEYDKLFTGPGINNYPDIYATDISTAPPTIYLYPPPNLTFNLTVRYMDNNVEIATPESSSTVPWFQDQLLLVKMLSEDLMLISDDARAGELFLANDEKMRRMLKLANDSEGRAQTVQKDPARFKTSRVVRPTKLQGW